jgi:Ni/Co efflux regulator RcnB
MKHLLIAAVAFSVLTGSAGFAQSDHRQDTRDLSNAPAHSQGRPDLADKGNGYRDESQQRSLSPRGNSAHQWNKGERLPPEFRDRQHVVDDYRGQHLRTPPHGYRWVTANNQYFLVGSQTGTIIDIQIGR